MRKAMVVICTIGKSIYLEEMLLFLRNEQRVVLVDNSENGCCALLAAKHEVEYVWEKNGGISSARNCGAAIEGDEEYIYFLDDDLTLSKEWLMAFRKILSAERLFDFVGGRVRTVHNLNKNLPSKYAYLVGEKDLGNERRVLHREYLGGCNMLVSREMFAKVNGFDVGLGHVGESTGLNEDVELQDHIRSVGGEVWYFPELIFVHHWKGDEKNIIQRVRLQGIYDRRLDLKMSPKRYVLRLVKYLVLIPILWVLSFRTSVFCKRRLDYLRYSAYVKGH